MTGELTGRVALVGQHVGPARGHAHHAGRIGEPPPALRGGGSRAFKTGAVSCPASVQPGGDS